VGECVTERFHEIPFEDAWESSASTVTSGR
jgi:hypothetical protein